MPRDNSARINEKRLRARRDHALALRRAEIIHSVRTQVHQWGCSVIIKFMKTL